MKKLFSLQISEVGHPKIEIKENFYIAMNNVDNFKNEYEILIDKYREEIV